MISVWISHDFRLGFPCLPFVQNNVSHVFRSIIKVNCPVTVVENVIMLIFFSDYVTAAMEKAREHARCYHLTMKTVL